MRSKYIVEMFSLCHSGTIVSKIWSVIIVTVLLACAAFLAQPLETRAWEEVESQQWCGNIKAVEDTLGQGLAVGILGGFRAILADLAWLQLSTVWTTEDRVKLSTMIRLVTTLDPRPEFFWINAARMVAYDVPAWRIRKSGGYDALTDIQKSAIDEEQANQAFEILKRGLDFHPNTARLPIEIGQIYLNRLQDDALAAKWFYEASKFPDAPEFVVRIYAELLRRQGKLVEAYKYLTSIYPSLVNATDYQQSLVLERIKMLENDLNITNESCYEPTITKSRKNLLEP